MQVRERRAVSRVIRAGLVVLAIVIAASWMIRKIPKPDHLRVEGAAPAAETFAAGDMQLFSEDSTVDVILAGDRISAGLSPMKLAEVRQEIEESTAKDTAGIGGSIAQIVKKTVADKLGMRVAYPLSQMQDIWYDDGRIMIRRLDGKESALLGDNVQVDGDKPARFPRAEAERFVAAVKARLEPR